MGCQRRFGSQWRLKKASKKESTFRDVSENVGVKARKEEGTQKKRGERKSKT